MTGCTNSDKVIPTNILEPVLSNLGIFVFFVFEISCTREVIMSSVVCVQGSEGFVVSSDSIVYKILSDDTGKEIGRVKGVTRKLFQIHDNIVVAAVGNWNSYFPVFNQVAKLNTSTDNTVSELHNRAAQVKDARIYILFRKDNKVQLDIVDHGAARVAQSGAIMYPQQVVNDLFLTVYESNHAKQIRKTGMLGMASLVHAYNSFAASLTSDISAPFDTILFLNDGIFPFSGNVTRLPVSDFI